ncbi:MAG TPA: DUF1517 domain-containing protein [Sandaracinaceae bacterium LLY-WYZ-13_1]|nr:DUF1517 domain-containing protein [Sandaracinaceae bacterium LLY-WYZ-13_1]
MDDREIDVSVLMLGIDAEARAEVQRAMDDIASHGDSGQPAGLVQMLREAIAVLRGVASSWTHAGAENAQPMPAERAEAVFGEATERARGRFEDEVVRNYMGTTVRQEPPDDLPENPTEPGVVVVTLVVAARRELRDVADVRDRRQIALALDALASIPPDDFVAMEVIWSPADDRDRASVEEIEAKYPELTRLSPGVA